MVDTSNFPLLKGTGTANLFNANGDSISMQITEVFPFPTTMPTPPVGSITGTYTILGGTGRFAGATGQFFVQRLSDLAGPTFTGGVIHDGLITLPNTENAQ